MSLLDTLKAKLDPELFAQVTDALGDDFDYDLVTRARLNTVIGQREAAKRALGKYQGTQQQTEPTENTTQDMQEAFIAMMQSFMGASQAQAQQQQQQQQSVQMQSNSTATAAAKAQELSMQQQIDAAVAAQVNQVKQQYAITEKLREANIVDPTLVLNGKLLDMSQIKWSEKDPAIVESGLEEQLTALKENRPYLFQTAVGGGEGAFGTGRGGVPSDVGSVTSMDAFLKLPMEQQIAFKNAHPDTVKGFAMQAGVGNLISTDF